MQRTLPYISYRGYTENSVLDQMIIPKACNCSDILRRNSVLVICGSQRVKSSVEESGCRRMENDKNCLLEETVKK